MVAKAALLFNVDNCMKKLLLLVPVLFVLIVAGCNTGPTTAQKDRMLKPNQDYNFFGIVQSSQGTFKAPSPTSFNISSSEITTRDNFSGDSVTLLWGLITLRDY